MSLASRPSCASWSQAGLGKEAGSDGQLGWTGLRLRHRVQEVFRRDLDSRHPFFFDEPA
jgi:hypothetical protein